MSQLMRMHRAGPGPPAATARSSSFSAPGRIGAPSGWRNRFTSTKSHSRAGGTISLEPYVS